MGGWENNALPKATLWLLSGSVPLTHSNSNLHSWLTYPVVESFHLYLCFSTQKLPVLGGFLLLFQMGLWWRIRSVAIPEFLLFLLTYSEQRLAHLAQTALLFYALGLWSQWTLLLTLALLVQASRWTGTASLFGTGHPLMKGTHIGYESQ